MYRAVSQRPLIARPSEFASERKLNEHYEKHGDEFDVESSHEYLKAARHVIDMGTPVHYSHKNTSTTGYILLMGTHRAGQVKFAFVGTNANGKITPLHTKSGKFFWKMINEDANDKTIRPYSK